MARENTDEFITKISYPYTDSDIANIQKTLNEGWTVKHIAVVDTCLIIVFSPPTPERAALQVAAGRTYTEQKQAEYKRRQEEYNKKKNQPVEKP